MRPGPLVPNRDFASLPLPRPDISPPPVRCRPAVGAGGQRSHRDAFLAEKWDERRGAGKREVRCHLPPVLPGVKVGAGFFLELLCAYSSLLAFPPKNKMEKSVVFLCHLVHFILIIMKKKKKKRIKGSSKICIIADF